MNFNPPFVSVLERKKLKMLKKVKTYKKKKYPTFLFGHSDEILLQKSDLKAFYFDFNANKKILKILSMTKR